MKKAVAFMMTLALSASLLAGCGSTAQSTGESSGEVSSAEESSAEETGTEDDSQDTDAASGEEKVVTVATGGSWDSLCPLASTTTNSDTVVNTIFENLFESDGKGGVIGRLAESYEMTDDNTAMVVHLRQDAVWHDGEPFDADDVIFSVGLYTNGDYTSSRRLFFQQVEGCTSSGVEESAGSAHVEKLDDYTVKFYYRQPVSAASVFASLNVSTFFIFPEHLLKDADPATILENDFWMNPIGTGPFKYESTVQGESLTVTAFDDYYLGRPNIDKLVMKVIPATNLVTAMMSGEVDLISGGISAINDSDYELATSVEGYTVESLESTSTQLLILNNETFSSAKIRKALAMMMDKDAMLQAGCNGNGTELYSMYASLSNYYDQDVVDEYGYSYDPDAAYQMLVEEGFDFDRTYVACINDVPLRQAIMTVMQATWEKYGMKLEIQTLDTQTCISTMRDGNCDFWINGSTSADVSDLATSFLDWCSINEDGSYAPFNLGKISDPTLMNLENELIGAVDEDEIKNITSEIQEYILTEYPYIWIVSPYINIAVSDRLTGVDTTQMVVNTFNYCDWDIQ